jgi:hypothetical protein
MDERQQEGIGPLSRFVGSGRALVEPFDMGAGAAWFADRPPEFLCGFGFRGLRADGREGAEACLKGFRGLAAEERDRGVCAEVEVGGVVGASGGTCLVRAISPTATGTMDGSDAASANARCSVPSTRILWRLSSFTRNAELLFLADCSRTFRTAAIRSDSLHFSGW